MLLWSQLIEGTEIGLKVEGLGIQLFPYTSTFCPLPIRHLDHFLSNCLPHTMLLQTNDGFDHSPAFIKPVCLKYLAFKTLATSELGNCIILHPCFATSAWLKLERSLKPIPPLAFE